MPTHLRCLALLLALAAPAGAQEGFVHDPPHGLVLDEREPGRIQLVWVPAEDNQRVTVHAYHVWRREGTGDWVQLASTKGDVTYYNDRRVTPGQAYAYRIVSEAVGTGRLLPPEQARRQSEAVGPVLALEPWYLSVERVTPTRPEGPDGSAWLRVHRWATERGAWEASDGFGVRTGGAIGQEGLAGDYRTGATLVAVWEAEAEGGPAGFVRYRRADGDEVELSTRDAPPGPVWKDAPRTRVRRGPPPETIEGSRERPAARAPARPGEPAPLRFPEPTRLETITGSKVLWEVENQTSYRLSVYYDGPSTGRAVVEPGETIVLRLVRGGDYFVFGRVATTDTVRPAEGQFSMLSGYRYRSTFTVAAAPRGP